MASNNKFKFLIVIAINLTISLAYYFENSNTTYSQLSSDLLNIIPIAQKYDNPELYKNDLYVDTIENVKYYTPFYVQTLRFLAKFNDYNYLQALNIMHTICHFVFGVLWFLLFFKYAKHFWLALFMSVFVRGIVWVPGLEVLGISGLWSMMPRTLYIALFPLPFLLLTNKLSSIIIASFIIGFIFNFHPITGLGGIMLFLLFLFFYSICFKSDMIFSFRNTVLVLLSLIVGMLPFILTYFGKTSSTVTYDLGLFDKAFQARIPVIFKNPVEFSLYWFKNKSALFLIPVIIYYIISKKNKNEFKKARVIALLTLLLFIIPLTSVYFESFVNNVFNQNFRMSFQLIRTQKMVVIPSYFAMFFLLVYFFKNTLLKNWLTPFLLFYFLVLVFSKPNSFISGTIFNTAIFNSVLPFNLSVGKPSQSGNKTKDAMAKYIEKNTQIDAVLFGDYFYRCAAKRSVILDNKGASMIIESNPSKLIQWYLDKQHYKRLATFNEKVEFLKSLGVDYYITENDNYNLKITHKINKLILYKLE